MPGFLRPRRRHADGTGPQSSARSLGPDDMGAPAARRLASRRHHRRRKRGTMGLTTGDFPPVDPATFMQTPYRERTKTLARHWVDYGFGAPKITPLIYVAKLLLFYALGGVLVATLTSGRAPLPPAAWWDEPIVYQKIVLWTVLLECLGLAGSWGPLAGHFRPKTPRLPHLTRA